jgi:hypothetical protein
MDFEQKNYKGFKTRNEIFDGYIFDIEKLKKNYEENNFLAMDVSLYSSNYEKNM